MICDMNRTIDRRTFASRVAAGAILLAAAPPSTRHVLARQVAATPHVVAPVWLAEQIEVASPGLVLLDLSDLSDYRSGHIPGAAHSFWLETVERNYGVYGTVLNQKNIDSDEDGQGKRLDWMRRHGISPGSHVVAYDRTDNRRAARIAWFLRFLGHERASVLDQGFAGWQGLGLAVNNQEEHPPPLTREPVVTPSTGFYVATEELQERLAYEELILLDIRSEAERADTLDGQFGLGAIPGSVWAPWTDPSFDLTAYPDVFDETAARAALESSGVRPNQRVVLYGRFGSDANQMWIVLKAAGYGQVEIYDRGWVEWDRLGLPAEAVT